MAQAGPAAPATAPATQSDESSVAAPSLKRALALHLTNVPVWAKQRQILNLFRDIRVLPFNVQFIASPFPRAVAKHAIVSFRSHTDVMRALKVLGTELLIGAHSCPMNLCVPRESVEPTSRLVVFGPPGMCERGMLDYLRNVAAVGDEAISGIQSNALVEVWLDMGTVGRARAFMEAHGHTLEYFFHSMQAQMNQGQQSESARARLPSITVHYVPEDVETREVWIPSNGMSSGLQRAMMNALVKRGLFITRLKAVFPLSVATRRSNRFYCLQFATPEQARNALASLRRVPLVVQYRDLVTSLTPLANFVPSQLAPPSGTSQPTPFLSFKYMHLNVSPGKVSSFVRKIMSSLNPELEETSPCVAPKGGYLRPRLRISSEGQTQEVGTRAFLEFRTVQEATTFLQQSTIFPRAAHDKQLPTLMFDPNLSKLDARFVVMTLQSSTSDIELNAFKYFLPNGSRIAVCDAHEHSAFRMAYAWFRTAEDARSFVMSVDGTSLMTWPSRNSENENDNKKESHSSKEGQRPKEGLRHLTAQIDPGTSVVTGKAVSLLGLMPRVPVGKKHPFDLPANIAKWLRAQQEVPVDNVFKRPRLLLSPYAHRILSEDSSAWDDVLQIRCVDDMPQQMAVFHAPVSQLAKAFMAQFSQGSAITVIPNEPQVRGAADILSNDMLWSQPLHLLYDAPV